MFVEELAMYVSYAQVVGITEQVDDERLWDSNLILVPHIISMDALGMEPRVSRMLSGCDTTTPRAP
eukprot:5487778-Karenia_brevis.AAC.1